MPNGRPGDHPYTDIVIHGRSLYTEPIREYVRAIDEYGEHGAVHRARSLLWHVHREYDDEELAALEADLRAVYEAVQRADEFPAESPFEAIVDGDDSLYDETIRDLVREADARIDREVDNEYRARGLLSGILWQAGWEPDDPDGLETDLRNLLDDHWIWDR